MNALIKYIILNAVRDWLYVGLLAILIIAFGISYFLGSTSLVEDTQMTLVYLAGSSRMIFMVGMVLFVCFHIARSFENKEVEFILAKAISRHKFILAYLAGFLTVGFLIILPIIAWLAFTPANKIGLIYWAVSIICEMLILVTFATLASMILRSAVSSVLATIGFYIISRMMGFFVFTISLTGKTYDIATVNNALKSSLKILSFIFPRLDLFAKSNWLIYNVNMQEFFVVAIQSAIYIPLLIFMAFYDFRRKQF